MILSKFLVLPIVSASLLPLAHAHSRVFCIKLERSATGQFTDCLQGIEDQSNLYIKHSELQSTTKKLTSGKVPTKLPDIAQGEVFTYVWSANNHGDIKAQQCELYRDPRSFTSTTTASTPEAPYAQWINAKNQIAVQRPFSNNEKKYPQSNSQYNRKKCVEFSPSDGSIWSRIYSSQNGKKGMTQKKFCYGQATMPQNIPVGPQRLIYHFWHEDSVNKDWVSVQYVNVVKAGTITQKSGYVEKDDGMNYTPGSYNGQTVATAKTSKPSKSQTNSKDTTTKNDTNNRSCIVTINQLQFDVTQYKPRHPGGSDVFQCGQDISDDCNEEHAGKCLQYARKYARQVSTKESAAVRLAVAVHSLSDNHPMTWKEAEELSQSDDYEDENEETETLTAGKQDADAEIEAEASSPLDSSFTAQEYEFDDEGPEFRVSFFEDAADDVDDADEAEIKSDEDDGDFDDRSTD